MATVGTITSGTWNGTTIDVSNGGTEVTSLTSNGVLIGNGTSAITAVDLSTKGSILVGDGSGNPSALGVGTNNYVLTADSNTATGIKWAAASGGGGSSITINNNTNNNVTANRFFK